MTHQRHTVKRKTAALQSLRLSYELICEIGRNGEEYSLLVSAVNEAVGYTYERLINSVTYSAHIADHIFELVSKGAVTPMTLCEVVEDILADD